MAPMVAAADPATLHPALWKVTRHRTTIWLFGTIHMLPPDARWLNGAVAQAADNADEIATEIDDADGARTLAALTARQSLPPGERLSTMISPTMQTALAQRLAGVSVDIDSKKPWFAAVLLSTLPLLRRGFDAHGGVEAQLSAREAARAVRRTGIETPDEQFGMLDSLPRASQIAYLSSVIDDYDQIDAQITAMFAAWGKGDATALAQLMNADAGKDDPVLIDRLITQRNHRFARWIIQRLRRPGRVFMAIGAGHLAGRGSVRDDLARAGIRVERVQ
ncbi:TraB/GumN family protein [Novosphingobium sp.]|uniref:TraB/GumN family protein n=1 Tax=Novosphingobium sp. TaxID=1874826 RepID=UPI00333E989B